MWTRVRTFGRAALPLVPLIALAIPGGAARAHAVLLETAPVDSTRLEAPPAELRLRFNEPVRPVVVQLLDTDGRPVDAVVEPRGATLALSPKRPLPRGGYVIAYRVMSGDGHPVAGTIAFGVGAAPPSGDQPPAPDAESLSDLATLARALHYGGVLVAAGGALFLALVGGMDRRLAGAIGPAALVALVGALVGAGVAGAIALGLPVAALFGPEPWRTGLSGTTGLSLLALVVGLSTLRSGVLGETRSVALAGAVIAAASLALTGHAVSAPPRDLATAALVVHVLTAAFWAGSLAPLWVALGTLPGAEAAALVKRFSRLALGAVPALILAGTVLSGLQLGGVFGIGGTDYGRLWLVKIGLVALLLGLAALNRLRLTPALERGEAGAPARLGLSIGAEMALVALVVLVTAGLGAAPPPRALAERASEPSAPAAPGYAALATTTAGTAVIVIDPARVGRNAVSARLSAPDGGALVPVGPAWLALSRPGAAPIRAALIPEGAGRLGLPEIVIPAPGDWTAAIEAGPLVFRATVPVSEDKP